MGEAPGSIVLVENRAGRRPSSRCPIPSRSPTSPRPRSPSTTPAPSSTAWRALPAIVGPRTDDICYATTNRQAAVSSWPAVRSGAGDRLVQLVELDPPGRGGARPGHRRAPDRQRGRRARAVAREHRRGRHHLRRQRARRIRPGPDRLLPRPRCATTSRSSTWCTSTCASCSRRRSARPWRGPERPMASARRCARWSSPTCTSALTGADLLRRPAPWRSWSRRSTAPSAWSCSATCSSFATGRVATPWRPRASCEDRRCAGRAARSCSSRATTTTRWSSRGSRAGATSAPEPLGLEQRCDWERARGARQLAPLGPAGAGRVAYPGLWLREDLYATHGHYLDRHTTVPILRAARGAGGWSRLAGEPPDAPRPPTTTRRPWSPSTRCIDACRTGRRARAGRARRARI